MKIIASTGGKGGTGKSTFAILLALKLSGQGKKVILCDADVECPNDYLIMNQSLKQPKKIYQDFPVLDEEKCKKCGRCFEVCRENAVFWVKGKYPTFIDHLCSGCGACWIACPQKAIKPKKGVAGESFINKVNDRLWLVTGRCKPTISETGPIVNEVRDRAIKLAEKIKTDYLILDTSPGTHCNVIQALLRCDKIYAVTEPTPLGAHDLGLILELIKRLKIPCEIVLNKADVGNRKDVEKIAEKFAVKIGYEIPYSEELIKAYCSGRLEDVVNLL